MSTQVMDAPELLGPGNFPGDDGDTASEPRRGRIAGVLGRYEVVFGTIAVMVIIVRIAGGGFISDRADKPGEEAAAVTPFEAPTAATSADIPDPVPAVSAPSFGLGSSSVTPSFDTSSPAVDSGSSSPSVGSGAAEESIGQRSVLATVPEPGAPAGVAVTRTGAVWVSTDAAEGAPKLFRFSPEGTLEATLDVKGVTGGITDLRFGPEGKLFALARTPAGVFTVDPATGATTKYAEIPDLTTCLGPVVSTNCDGALVNQPPQPTAMAFAADGTLYVADAGQGAIWKVTPAGKTEQWLVKNEWTNPTRPAGPTGLAVDGAGNLVVAVQALLSEDVGVVYVIALGDKGAAGEVKELARTGDASRPAGLVLSAAGKVLVALSGAGVVVVIGADGKEVGRTPEGEPLDTPTGLTFRGRSVLVTVKAPGKPSAGQVVRLPVGETGAPSTF